MNKFLYIHKIKFTATALNSIFLFSLLSKTRTITNGSGQYYATVVFLQSLVMKIVFVLVFVFVSLPLSLSSFMYMHNHSSQRQSEGL